MSAVFSRAMQRYGVLFDAATVDRINWPPVARPRTYVEPERAHDEPPRYGLFELSANNNKRRAGKPVQQVTCYGALYPDGAVQLHTNALGILDFLSWQQFTDHMDALGEYRVVWLALPPSDVGVPS